MVFHSFVCFGPQAAEFPSPHALKQTHSLIIHCPRSHQKTPLLMRISKVLPNALRKSIDILHAKRNPHTRLRRKSRKNELIVLPHPIAQLAKANIADRAPGENRQGRTPPWANQTVPKPILPENHGKKNRAAHHTKPTNASAPVIPTQHSPPSGEWRTANTTPYSFGRRRRGYLRCQRRRAGRE